MPKDLSQQSGNPTSYIHDNYQDLMALSEQDPEAAAQQIIQAAQEMVGRGLSELNFRKLKMRAMKAVQRGSFGVQKYVSDYMLKGMGHGDIKTGGRGAYESAEAIGSLITEDPDTPQIKWNRELIFIESVLKQYGLELVIEDEFGRGPVDDVEAVRQFVRGQIEEWKLDPEYGPGNDAGFIPIDELPIESIQTGYGDEDGQAVYNILSELTDEFDIEEEGGGFYFAEKERPENAAPIGPESGARAEPVDLPNQSPDGGTIGSADYV